MTIASRLQAAWDACSASKGGLPPIEFTEAEAEQLAAALASTAPRDGWVMVPREATEEMLNRGKRQPNDLRQVYAAMIDAAPSVGEG